MKKESSFVLTDETALFLLSVFHEIVENDVFLRFVGISMSDVTGEIYFRRRREFENLIF